MIINQWTDGWGWWSDLNFVQSGQTIFLFYFGEHFEIINLDMSKIILRWNNMLPFFQAYYLYTCQNEKKKINYLQKRQINLADYT